MSEMLNRTPRTRQGIAAGIGMREDTTHPAISTPFDDTGRAIPWESEQTNSRHHLDSHWEHGHETQFDSDHRARR